MKKITNHFRAIVAIVMMLCVAFPSLAHDFEVDGIYYNYLDESSKTVEVTYTGLYHIYNDYTGAVAIPSSVTYSSTTYSVTSIGDRAFFRCTGLTSVRIPNSVTSIGEEAFYGCRGLTSVRIPNSVTSIGDRAFQYCDGLESMVVASGNSVYDSRDNCNAIIETTTNTLISGCKNSIIPNSVTSIGSYAFSYCTGLTSVTIPNSVTSIGNRAFHHCTGLKKVNYNAVNCTSMGSSSYPVFEYCSNFKTLNIGNNVKTIPDYAFSRCSGLTEVTIPNSVTSIGSEAFYKCTGLTSVRIPNSVTSIGKSAFSDCTGLTSVTIGNYVTSIGERAFHSCTGLTSVTIGNSVTSIGNRAFEDCTGLTTVNYNAENCTSMGSSDTPVFSDCSNLITLNIGNEVKTIPSYAFYNCTGLTSVTIPNSVTTIGLSAFYNCTNLTTVNYNAENCSSMGSLNYPVFRNLKTLNIGNNVKTIPSDAFIYCRGLTSVTIPNSVTSIGNYAFYNCTSLTSVTIGNSVTSIDKWAFGECTGLTSVTIPNSVTSIGDYAFFSCYNLTSVTIPNSVTKIGAYAFSNTLWYNNLAYGVIYINNVLYIYKGTMPEGTSISIKEGTISISPRAFKDCRGLTSVTIPNSVTSIGYEAFCGCTNLKEIVSLSENPPVCENNSFDSENYTNSTLYVPKDSYAKYFINDVWGQFNNIVKLENLVSNISINSSSISLESGKTTTLSATVLPSSATFPNLYWESNNENVATVDQTGKVTAHSKGEAIITAKSMDGSNITASCVVKVFTYDVESITLSQHDATLAIKDKVTLKYTITPSYVTDNSVTWSNSNPSVASMAKNSDGSVTISCQEEGETIIKVTTNDGTNLSDSCKIIVYRIPPTITLSKTSENLLIHNTVNLKYTITNSTINTATWTTSDATVASITSNTDGLVTVFAEAEGVATITATMIDVNGKEFSATCEITVIPPTIVLSQTVANLPVNELLTLNYDITNSSIKNATWTTSNPDVAPIKVNSDGSVIVVGLSEGEAIITATMTEVNGVEYSASCKVTVGIGGVEGIETDNNSKEVVRYDIHGRLLSEPTKGINIIKMSDGSTRKEIVK